jgi:hypothetical protein
MVYLFIPWGQSTLEIRIFWLSMRQLLHQNLLPFEPGGLVLDPLVMGLFLSLQISFYLLIWGLEGTEELFQKQVFFHVDSFGLMLLSLTCHHTKGLKLGLHRGVIVMGLLLVQDWRFYEPIIGNLRVLVLKLLGLRYVGLLLLRRGKERMRGW